MKPVAIVAALFLFHANSNAGNECMATLKDPHGSVDVSCDGDITATLKAGEHFLTAPAPNGWNVYLKSGCNGFIDRVDLQLLPHARRWMAPPQRDVLGMVGSYFISWATNLLRNS